MARYTPSNKGGDLVPINVELEKIKEAIDDTLSRKGDLPNAMQTPLDMNGNRILNLPKPKTDNEPARLKDIQAESGLPVQDSNAGKYLQTDGSAATWQQVQATDVQDNSSRTVQDTVTKVDALTVATVAEAKALDVPVGTVVETQGYYSSGDGGANRYVVVSGGTGTDDGGSFIDMDNGNQAKGLFPWGVWLSQFGVLPNSGNNETVGITAAIDYHIASGKRLRGGFGVYLFDGITRNSKSDISIEGVGVSGGYLTLKSTVVDQRTLRFLCRGDYETATLAADIAIGEDNVTLTDASNLQAGMLIRITSNVLWPYDNRGVYYRGETHLIDRVDGNTIYFTDRTRDNYTIAQIDNITAWLPAYLNLKNIYVDQSDFCGDTCYQLEGYLNPRLENVKSRKSKSAGVWLLATWNAKCKDIYSEFIGDGIQAGYGIQDRSGVNTVINGLYTAGCRRSFDAHTESGTFSSPARDYKVINFDIRGGGDYFPNTAESSYGIGNHGPAENGLFANGQIHDCRIGVNHRGSKLKLNNIDIIGKCFTPVDGTFGSGFDINNVNYYAGEYPETVGGMSALTLTDLPECFVRFGRASTTDADFNFDLPVAITNCSAVGVKDSFIFSENSTQKLGNITCIGNSIKPSDDASLGDFYFVRHLSTFSRSLLQGNKVELSGRAWNYCNGLIGEFDGIDKKYAVNIDGTYVFRVADDDYIIVGMVGNYVGARPIIGLSADAGGREIFEIRPENANRILQGQTTFADLSTTATPSSINGAFGTDGNYTIGLTAKGHIYFENRGGSARNFRLSEVC